MPAIKLHPLIKAAGRDGDLPDWARLSKSRRRHSERVTDLLGTWAEALGLERKDRIRWCAAGMLHDALKDASPKVLKRHSDEDWPLPLLHGAAVAGRLRREGVKDEALLLALKYHSIGHPDFGLLGQHLYLADYLEPGRGSGRVKRGKLRRRMPEGRTDVLPVVVKNKLAGRLEGQAPVFRESLDFWNGIVSG
jgi:HD superfamily phosphohydrolase YqeK